MAIGQDGGYEVISTKGRYAVRVLIDLAKQGDGAIVPLRDIARRQDVSEKYLQHIVKPLVENGLVIGVSGKGGGYRYAKAPSQISVLEVLGAVEESMVPVACLACNAEPCERAAQCETLSMWKGYDALTRDYFSEITIATLAEKDGV